ncbi:MAG: formylglycine-generating enzyme family protein [Bacteroidetes bacterium]|nr:formylglycine-generating enzyme family protein [Bacteroidota bacterium]
MKINFKKIFLSICIAECSVFLFAQNSNDNFSAYEQTVPGSSIRFKMMPIPAGTFLMGSNNKDKNRKQDEGPQKQINISAFWMGAYEVSRDEFDVFYKDESVSQNNAVDAVTRPSPQYIDFSLGMGKEGGYPVNSLSQHAALMFCRWLYNKTGIFYRLPTEAEWEYACHAGNTTTYYFGNDISELGKYAWFADNGENKFHKSGQKLPNAWGLYDMLGNVSEWTLDHYDEKMLEKLADKTTDPTIPVVAARFPKVLKGGGYSDDAEHLRIANRIKSDPSWNKRDPQIPKSKWWLTEASSVGFRVVRPLNQPSVEEANDFYKKYLGK